MTTQIQFSYLLTIIKSVREPFGSRILSQRAGAGITQKKKLHPKFLQNSFFHTSIYVIQGRNFHSAIESATQNFFLKFAKMTCFS